MKPILISLNDLDEKPCEKYYDYIIKNYGENGLFNPLETIEKLNDGYYADVSWLIINCKKYQTQEMLDYYKSLNPDYKDVLWLIAICKFCQTDEMIDFYKSLNPDYNDVFWLIFNYENCRTKKMYNYLESLKL